MSFLITIATIALIAVTVYVIGALLSWWTFLGHPASIGFGGR